MFLTTMKRLISLLFLLLPAVLLSAETLRYAVIPVEFSDVSFTNTKEYVDNKVASARAYLDGQFAPGRTFVFDILPVIRLPYPMSRYGANSSSMKDVGIDEAIRAACTQSSADFSRYDNNSDGRIDNICIVFAGQSESAGYGSQYIWPQHIFLHDRGGALSIGSKTADSFSVCAEFSSPGVFAHEFCHSLGLMDLYDTDGKLSGGTSKGLWGGLSLMDNPEPMTNLCSIDLEQLGMGTCLDVVEGSYRLRPLSRYKEYLKIPTDNQNEYYLLECRDNRDSDAHLGGRGLVIYHIDRSLSDSWYSDMYRRNLTAMERWSLNEVNCRPEHECARVVEAVPGTDNIQNIFFPQEGHTSFGSETNPPFRFWSGGTSSIALTDITLQDDGSVTFNLITPLVITSTDVFQDAAIITWSIGGGLAVRECIVSWYASEGKTPSRQNSMTVIPGSSGICSATIEGLAPQTDYQAAVRLVCFDGAIYSTTLEFRTKMKVAGARPFIWLNSLQRADDGTFVTGGSLPLRIFNGEGIQEVRWYFNGFRIFPDEDGHWILPGSGTLKAEAWLADGSKEIIIKEIKAR